MHLKFVILILSLFSVYSFGAHIQKGGFARVIKRALENLDDEKYIDAGIKLDKSSPKLCFLSCFVPCYVNGKNAEALGEDCLLTGLLSIWCPVTPIIRNKIRQEKQIEGSMILDAAYHALIPCCAIRQEAVELGWDGDSTGTVTQIDRT
ncbi:hypothetical protein A3Q56_02540 [Intoshia linei]|uniref:Uncharacterized protein n=1 Tax=Intoshia linei TaxID=1819745 RepID=A0A177B645_9BILA|nr:hypothetical protein A3Q56_02540 [Intoshia linei]